MNSENIFLFLNLKSMRIIRQRMQNLTVHLMNFQRQLDLLDNQKLTAKDWLSFVTLERHRFVILELLCVKGCFQTYSFPENCPKSSEKL